MKTTYVLDYKELSKLKLHILPKIKYVDYFFRRDRMIRWEPNTNKFTEFVGLIDISFVRQLILTPDETKKEINIRNVQYLVRRELMSEYCFEKDNEWGKIWHVVGEDVQNKVKLFDEYQIVFDIKLDEYPPFPFKTVFYGNIYDYLELKKTEESSSDNG